MSLPASALPGSSAPASAPTSAPASAAPIAPVSGAAAPAAPTSAPAQGAPARPTLPAAGQALQAAPQGAAQVPPQAQPQPGQLTPDQQNAFAQRLAAERSRIEATANQHYQQQYNQLVTGLANRLGYADAGQFMQALSQGQLQVQQQQAAAAPMTPEEYHDRWYNDPIGLHREMSERFLRETLPQVLPGIETLQQVAEREQEKAQWSQEVSNLQQRYGDQFDAAVPAMQSLLAAAPELADLPVDRLFRLAVNYSTQQQPPQQADPAAVAQMLHDPQYQAQISDPAHPAYQAIVRDYLERTRKGMPPVIISGQPASGASAVQAPSTPRTLAESTRNWKSSLGLR